MDIVALKGMDLIAIEWSSTRFEFVAIDDGNDTHQVVLSNPDQSPIQLIVHWAHFRFIFDEDRDLFTFGELESIVVDGSTVHIEADAGYFSVGAQRCFVQSLTNTPANDS